MYAFAPVVTVLKSAFELAEGIGVCWNVDESYTIASVVNIA